MLDGASDLDNRVDAGGPAQQQCVLGDGRHALLDGQLKLGNRLDGAHDFKAGLLVGAPGFVERAVGNGHHPHSGSGINDLQGYAAGHEAGPDQPHPNGPPLAVQALQGSVNDDHDALSLRMKLGQWRSLSDMSSTGTGQSMAKAGSSWRAPCSAAGV